MTPQPWRYQFARVLRVIDGDTLEIELDLGFRLRIVERFRLRDYNAPELKSSDPREHAMGAEAWAQLQIMLADRRVEVASWKADSFGRWLADVTVIGPEGDALDVVEQLVAGGWGVRWDGRGKAPRPWLDAGESYPMRS